MTLDVPTLRMPRRLFYGDRSFRFRVTEPARSTRIVFCRAVSTITDVGAGAGPSRGSARSTLSRAVRFFRLYAPQRPVSTPQPDTSRSTRSSYTSRSPRSPRSSYTSRSTRSPRSSYTGQQLGENVYSLLEKHRGLCLLSLKTCVCWSSTVF